MILGKLVMAILLNLLSIVVPW